MEISRLVVLAIFSQCALYFEWIAGPKKETIYSEKKAHHLGSASRLRGCAFVGDDDDSLAWVSKRGLVRVVGVRLRTLGLRGPF